MTYPHAPGAAPVDTSLDAAASIDARTLRLEVLAILARWPEGLTADEVAAVIGRDRLAIRPRLSELKRLGMVRDSGQRRPNRSGRSAAVMVAA